MRRLRSLLHRLTGLFNKTRHEREMADEFDSLLAIHIDANIEAGMSPQEARRQALIQFGGIEPTKESYRDAISVPFLDNLIQDTRYGLRMLRRSPGFTIAAVLLLALGIGANTAVYSFMDALLLRALPVQNPESLMVLKWQAKDRPPLIRSHSGESHREPARGFVSGNFPYRALEFLRANNQVFTNMFGFFGGRNLTLQANGAADSIDCQYVSGDFFSSLGLVPSAGRLIDPSDDRQGAPGAAVISHSYWQSRFGQADTVAGKAILINDIPFTIIGVAPPEFFGVDPSSNPQIYLSARFYESMRPNTKDIYIDDHWYWIQIMGRLRPGVSMRQAEAALSSSFAGWVANTAPSDKERANLPVLYLQEGAAGLDLLRAYFSKPLYLLVAMTVLILAIACANVANLLLARATARRREIAMRQGLGASRWRVARQLLTESLLLSTLGGALGVFFAIAGIRGLSVLVAGWQSDINLHAELNWNVLAAAVALTMFTGIIFGLAPAIQAARVQFTSSGARNVAPGNKLRGALVAAQIAISLLLLAGAGLFLRTLSNLQSVAKGFNDENLLLFTLNARQAGYKDESLARFYANLRERAAAIPGVRDVTMTGYPLVSGSRSSTGVWTPDAPKEASTLVISVGPKFLATMQIPLLLGRDIEERDGPSSPRVAIINEAFAAKYFAGINPLGQSFRFNRLDKEPMQIVGIAKNALVSSLKEPPGPTTYTPYSQNLPGLRSMTFALRTASDPLTIAASVQRIAAEADDRIPITGMKTQRAQIGQTIGQERLFASLCTIFAILALGIAAVGLYATIAYSVARRTAEIGIRMALGAQRPRLVGMIFRESLLMIAAGIAIGLPIAWILSRLVESFVFGMKPADPPSFAAAIAILLVAAAIAGFLPAWRASGIAPMDALRHE